MTSPNPDQLPLPVPSPSSSISTEHKHSITDFTITIPGSKLRPNTSNTTAAEQSRSRWNTLEFRLYMVVFVLVVPMMVWVPIRLSRPSHHNYWNYEYRLSEGWFGYKVDNSDAQYRSFRSNLLPLLILSSIYLISSHLFSRLTTPSPDRRLKFIVGFSTFMIILLHGFSSLKIFLILSLNYYISKLPITGPLKRIWPAVLIVLNIGVLFVNERNDGFRYGELHAALGTLDNWSGLLPRWHISFNITMMRMVSFGIDYLWKEQNTNQEYRKRVNTSLPSEHYSYINYLAYCLYPPLYIAGPIITFNDFIWQIRNPTTISTKEKISYGVRFLFSILTMESVLHTMYVVAIKDTKAWQGDSPAEMSMIGFWNLVVVWLKLLIPWRFFRLWALSDGLDPPENMIRCVANNYSTLGFWRSWHRSYNLWVVRYIYIPVGGSKNTILATALVFTFVALWHDLSFKLLAWGWLVSLFILPELLARKVFTASKYGQLWYYRHICAVGGVINILLMMSANLVGFVLGLEGMKVLLVELTSTISGWFFMTFASCCLFVAVQVMFEYREEEKRRGIDRRC
uniref:Glycerol transporter n=1 Tax=Kwoniella bestiolae CBS 10118 TaxID=1296100 RepID=A0A1B9GCF3_9TREE|nr:glycerol transporter [Kwoniella bestiolae CBS 10118]OCF28706.1 glycerol transporter [Kwoniella bestiolae CBS 10118]